MSELRKDPVSGRWVIIAPERAKRPDLLTEKNLEKKDKSNCPFCPGKEHLTGASILELKNNNNWKVRVFANRLPALRVEGDIERKAEGLYDFISGIGAHEIIVETPDHGQETADMDSKDIEYIIKAYQSRVLDLYNDTRLRYVLIFKNFGTGAGAYLEHSHSQLIATPIIPQSLKSEYEHAMKYYLRKERCLFCDLLNQEIKDGKRVISENEGFVLYTPYASRLPFEMHILPKRHHHDFSAITTDEIKRLSSILKEALLRLKTALDTPSYNLILHSGPNRRASGIPGKWQTIAFDYHWHIEILPRLTHLAGFEWGSGLYINPSLPEDTAPYLRSLKI